MIPFIALVLLLTFGCLRGFRFAVCNLAYTITHPFRIKRSSERLRAFYGYCTDLLALDSWIESSFRYKSDIIDYASWPIVFAMKWDKHCKWNGDCDDVANLAYYWAKKKHHKASYVSIKRPAHQVGHAVCLVKVGVEWMMIDSTGVVPFMGWATHYPNCKIIIRKTR